MTLSRSWVAGRALRDGATDLKSVCIYGAGAIGGWIGASLAGAGGQVSLLARGATLAALRQHGLRLTRGDKTQVFAVAASDKPQELGVQDLVVIAVKAPAMPDVARQIAPLLGAQTIVLTAMNGVPWWFLQSLGGAQQGKTLEAVDPGGAIHQRIPIGHVIGGVVHASCSLLEAGWVRHHVGERLVIGEPSGEKSPRLAALAELLKRAGLQIEISERIQRDIWFKLWGNMTMNPVSALTGATCDRILDDPQARAFILRAMAEAKEIGARIGCPIAQSGEDRHAVTRKLGAFKTSMLQDVQAGRAIELDALVTVVREIGQAVGAPTAEIDTLLGLTRLMAQTRALYGVGVGVGVVVG